MAKKKIKSPSLSDKALLVVVNISQWSGRKTDKKASETVSVTHKTSTIAGNYSKKLLPGSVELAMINEIAGRIRKYFHEQTLPWMSDGSRIIASQNYMNFVAGIRKLKADFESAVRDFEAAYPKLKADAVKSLGDLYDPEEYPEDIGSKFAIEVAYLPLPDVKDFRVSISEQERKNFEKKIREVELAAVGDCWERLHKVVKTAADKLANPGTIFRDSLIENIKDIVELLPMLNVTNDSDLEKSRKEVEKLVKEISLDTVREDLRERSNASKKLADIESKMSAFMGRSNVKRS